MTPIAHGRIRNRCVVFCAALLVTACASAPKISSQTAPEVNLTEYHTYGFMEQLSTDSAGYTSITTQLMKQAVGRELAARGYTEAANPDILVNFVSATKDKVEGHGNPRVGVTYGTGGWGHGGWGGGVGVGVGGSDVHSVREDSLTVDLVDRAKNELVWSGSAVYRHDAKDKNDTTTRVIDAVTKIFARYPRTKIAYAK